MPILKNSRHERYCHLRTSGKTIDDAYDSAGFKPNRGNAARLNANDSIQARIKELMAAGAERAEITVAQVLEEMACVAFADMGKFVDVDAQGNVSVNFQDISKGDLRAVTKIRQKHMNGDDGKTVIETQFELASKTTGLEQLAKHLGMFIERSKVEQDIRYLVGDKVSEEDAESLPSDWSERFKDIRPNGAGAHGANGKS